MNLQKNEILAYFSAGEDRFKIAQKLLKNGFVNESIHRLYFAVFYYAKSLLLAHNISTKTHEGINISLGLLIYRFKYPKELSKIFSEMRDARENIDYEAFPYFSKKDVENFMKKLKLFRKITKEIIKKKIKEEF